MSGVLNDCDALLQGASVRIVNPANAWINLATSAPGFHLNAAGVADLAVVTVTADLFGLDEAVAFSAVGGTLSNANGKSVDVTYNGSTAIVTATVVSGGEEFKRSTVIPVLRDGAAGAAGQVSYTWIKYADTAAGVGLSDDPAGKAYIGLAYNKSTSVESTTPGDYAWSQLKGGDGVPGTKGADGITYYTWIKYADQADGTGLYDAPNANSLYIGIAVNRTTATESTTKTDYVWSRFKGEQGVAGAPTYTWIKYADSAAGAGLSDDPTGKLYIGFAYNKSTATESTVATDYTWALIKGTDGQPGGKGADGATLYTWIKYSDVADGTGLYDLPTASTLFIGIATNKSTATESTVKTDYVWSKFKGDQGVQGPTTYTWVKYADSAAGVGLSDDPTGKAYIGFAYNKATASESTTATDYTWSLIKGTDGQPGGKGADGATLYTWIKYSDNADGTGLYDLPTASTQYLGIAVNKTTATESTVKTDYVWSKFRGADGVGTAGARGAGHYYVAGSSWSDVVAQAACPGGPVVNDVVTISSGTFVMEKRWTGSAWVDNGVVINGKLIVPDSILASAIDTRNLTIRDAQGNVILGAGSALAAGFEAPGTKNSELTPAIAAASGLTLIPFNNVSVTGNRAAKIGGASAWDSSAQSKDGYTGGAYFSAFVEGFFDIMLGLSIAPGNNAGFADIALALYQRADGKLEAYESGVSRGIIGSYVPTDVIAGYFDGSAMRYSKNGLDLFTFTPAALPTSPLYFDSSFGTPGAAISKIQFGPMSSNAWGSIGGTGKPQNNATVGAPSGTMVGGTEAGLVASRAMNGESAYNAQAAMNTAIAAKLNAAGNQVLSGPITLQSAGAIVAGSTTNGTTMSPSGLAHRVGGETLVSLTAGGVAVKGDISGSTGTFGAVTIGSTMDVAAGGRFSIGTTAYGSGSGLWFGFHNGIPKFRVGDANQYIDWDGSKLTQKLDEFSVAITGTMSSTVGTGAQFYGSLSSAITGDTAGGLTYSWSILSYSSDNGLAVQYYVSAFGDTATASFGGSANNNRIIAYVQLTVRRNSDGRMAVARRNHVVTHGTYNV